MRCVVEGIPYTVFGYKGKQVRDNIHSHDYVAAVDHFYRAPRVGRGLQHRRRPVLQLLHARSDRALRGDRRQAPDVAVRRHAPGRRPHLVDQRARASSASTIRAGRSGTTCAATLEQMLEQSRGPLGLTGGIDVARDATSARWSAPAKPTGAAIPATSPVKLRWRALTVRHCFHVLPGRVDSRARCGQRAVDRAPGDDAARRESAHGRRVQPGPRRAGRGAAASQHPRRLPRRARRAPAESFDYIVGTAILCHDAYAENLAALYRLLKPGGQLLFFEANYWNPQVFLKIDDPADRPVDAGDARLPDRDAQVPADEAGLAPGVHARRDRALRHRSPADAAVADSRGPVGGLHPRARAGDPGSVRHALHLAGEARRRAAAAREPRHAPAAVRRDLGRHPLPQRGDERPPADRRAARGLRRVHPRDHHRRRQQHGRHGRRGAPRRWPPNRG